MDGEEKIEEVEVENTASEQKKGFNLKNPDNKKYYIYGGIALAIIVVLIILISIFGGGPKKAVKNFIGGFNSRNAKKIANSIDFTGLEAWGWSYDADDFSKDDYKEFIENYKDADKDDIKEYKEDMIDDMEDSFDDFKDEYKSYKMKVDRFKKVEKLGKDLYAVKAKVSVKAVPKDKDEDEIDDSSTMTFVVYKNKLISLGGLSALY